MTERRRNGILIRWCEMCQHFHGRWTNRCMEPRCTCSGRSEMEAHA